MVESTNQFLQWRWFNSCVYDTCYKHKNLVVIDKTHKIHLTLSFINVSSRYNRQVLLIGRGREFYNNNICHSLNLEALRLVVVADTLSLGHTIIIKTRGPNRHTRTAKALNWIATDITADWYLASVAT